MVAAAMALMVPTATAQKINEESTLSKLAKSDAEVADAKKAEEAQSWLVFGGILVLLVAFIILIFIAPVFIASIASLIFALK